MMIKKPKLCAYCGRDRSHGPMDREHFAAQCLWAGPLPGKTRTVPAHVTCNQAVRDDAEYLRDVLVMEAGAGSHPAVQQHQATIQRKIKNNFTVFKKTLKGVSMRPIMTPGGIYLGEAPSFKVDWPRMQRALQNVMRGVYYSVNKEPLAPDSRFKVIVPGESNLWLVKHYVKVMVQWTGFGDDVFGCRYVFPPSQPGAMACLMMFYRHRVFFGLACPQNHVANPRMRVPVFCEA